MDPDVLLVDYVLDISVVWRLRSGYRLVVRVRGELSDWAEVNLLRGPSLLSGWAEVNLLRGLLSGRPDPWYPGFTGTSVPARAPMSPRTATT